jgi:hypothetical protein
LAYSYWPKDPKARKKGEGKGKTKKGRSGNKKQGKASKKSTKNRFWKTLYCQGFDKIKKGDEITLTEVGGKGRKLKVTATDRDKQLAEIDAYVAKNPSKYKLEIKGKGSFDMSAVSQRFKMGKGKKKESFSDVIASDSASMGAFTGVDTYTFYVFNVPLFCREMKKIEADSKKIEGTSFLSFKENAETLSEKKPDSWFTDEEKAVDPVAKAAESTPTVPKQEAPFTQVEGKKAKKEKKKEESQKKVCFTAVLGKTCDKPNCQMSHDAQEAARFKEYMSTQPCKNGAECKRKNSNCFWKHPEVNSKPVPTKPDQLKVQAEQVALAQSVKPKNFADAAKKGESLLGRKKIPATHKSHKCVKVLYNLAGVKPILHATFARNQIFTINHDGHELSDMKAFVIKHNGADVRVEMYSKDDKPLFKLCQKQQDGDLISIPIPIQLKEVPQLKLRKPHSRSDLSLLTLIPEDFISSGAYLNKDEHSCPSVEGDCGAPLIDSDGFAVGIHNAGGHSENGFVEFTDEILADKNQLFQ